MAAPTATAAATPGEAPDPDDRLPVSRGYVARIGLQAAPALLTATARYVLWGPPLPSWGLRFTLVHALLRRLMHTDAQVAAVTAATAAMPPPDPLDLADLVPPADRDDRRDAPTVAPPALPAPPPSFLPPPPPPPPPPIVAPHTSPWAIADEYVRPVPAWQAWTRRMAVALPADATVAAVRLPSDAAAVHAVRGYAPGGAANAPLALESTAPVNAEWVTHGPVAMASLMPSASSPPPPPSPPSCMILQVHGGGYTFFGPKAYRRTAYRWAKATGAAVLTVDYRLAPQHAFPCALADVLTALRWLQRHHAGTPIVLVGDSAGGGLIAALLLTLRDRGDRQPAGAVLMSPWLDLTHRTGSIRLNRATDYLPPMGPITPAVLRARAAKAEGSDAPARAHANVHTYTANAHLAHPRVSPLYEPDLRRLAPLLVQVGGAEVLRDEGCLFAARAASSSDSDGAAAAVALEIYEQQVHVFQAFPPALVPAGRTAWAHAARFVRACAAAAAAAAAAADSGAPRADAVDRADALGLGEARRFTPAGAVAAAWSLRDAGWAADLARTDEREAAAVRRPRPSAKL